MYNPRSCWLLVLKHPPSQREASADILLADESLKQLYRLLQALPALINFQGSGDQKNIRQPGRQEYTCFNSSAGPLKLLFGENATGIVFKFLMVTWD